MKNQRDELMERMFEQLLEEVKKVPHEYLLGMIPPKAPVASAVAVQALNSGRRLPWWRRVYSWVRGLFVKRP